MKLPKVIICQELPQWIISSYIAAYHPTGNTIYLKRRAWWKMLRSLGHEFCHFIGHQLGGRSHWIHRWLDGEERAKEYILSQI